MAGADSDDEDFVARSDDSDGGAESVASGGSHQSLHQQFLMEADRKQQEDALAAVTGGQRRQSSPHRETAAADQNDIPSLWAQPRPRHVDPDEYDSNEEIDRAIDASQVTASQVQLVLQMQAGENDSLT